MMYNRILPSYNTKGTEKKKEEDWDESIDANNPENFKTDSDEEVFIR